MEEKTDPHHEKYMAEESGERAWTTSKVQRDAIQSCEGRRGICGFQRMSVIEH